MSDTSSGRPLVSVGIFAFNHEAFIAQAVSSVVRSSFTDWELLVVDDGSADGTVAAIRAEIGPDPDPRIRVLADGSNRGLAARLNEVADLALGDWLAVLGGDDKFLRDGLRTLVAGIGDGVDVVWGDLEVVDSLGRPKGYARPRDTWQGPVARRYVRPGRPGLDLLRVNNFVCGTSPLVRLDTLRAIGGYTPGVRNEDLDLWLRLGQDHAFRYVDAPVAQYRVVSGSSSRSEAAAMMDQAAIVRRQLDLGRYPRDGLARLLAMRWLLTVARGRGRAAVDLQEVADAAGLAKGELLRQMPRAGWDPLAGSARALVTRRGRP